MNQNYDNISLLCKVNYGNLYRGIESSSGKQVALKIMESQVGTIGVGLTAEIKIACIIKNNPHPHIMEVLDVNKTSTSGTIVTAYYARGDLYSYIESIQPSKLALNTVQRMFGEIVLGLTHLHGMGIAHQDISLENILLSNSLMCKICDFGMSVDDTACKGISGKPFYVAPEMYTAAIYDPFQADMWSLGIILFILLTGMPLISNANDSSEFQYFKEHGLVQLISQYDLQLPSSQIVLLQKLLQVDPIKRYKINDILLHLTTF